MEHIIKFMSKKILSSPAEVKKQIGARIKELRNERGLTQEELAGIMNKQASYIGAIEAGKKFPRIENFIKIAQSLGVPLYQLFMFETDITLKQKALHELVDYLKNRPKIDTKFMLSVCREHVKQYSSEK